MIDYLELAVRIHDDGPVWVRLYNGIIICLTGVIDGDTFVAKFIPCSRNAREYKIAHREIKEFHERNELRTKIRSAEDC